MLRLHHLTITAIAAAVSLAPTAAHQLRDEDGAGRGGMPRVAEPVRLADASATGGAAGAHAGHEGHAAPAATPVVTLGAAALRRMVAMPAGTHRPLYGESGARARVAAFRLDRDPVTRGEFLAFVRANPEWRRDRVSARVADGDSYLGDWRGALDAGDAAELRRPATGVSWHAARAYCAAQGKRLPTVAEWEYAAAASATERDAAHDPRFIAQLLALYGTRRTPLRTVDEAQRNLYGVRGLHDLGWEWTLDFDGGAAAHEARDPHMSHVHGGEKHDLSCAGSAIGATDPGNYPAFLRFAMRSGLTASAATTTLGFRCAA